MGAETRLLYAVLSTNIISLITVSFLAVKQSKVRVDDVVQSDLWKLQNDRYPDGFHQESNCNQRKQGYKNGLSNSKRPIIFLNEASISGTLVDISDPDRPCVRGTVSV